MGNMIRYSSMQQVMESCGVSALSCVATLEFLKTIIHRPFTPNAADNKLMGETRDILEFFDFTDCPDEILYLSFLSHKKTNGANVGRLFVDRVRVVLLDEGYLARKPQARAIVERVRSENLVFFDSQNLKDLTKLNEHVRQSRNHLLLLTAGVLERPWVLVEIVRAYELKLNFICILVEWGDTEVSQDPRQFAFPREIDEALSVRYLLPCRRTRCPVSAPLKWIPFTPIRGTVISECCESDDQRLSQKALLSFVLVRARPVLTSICGGILCTFLVDSPVVGCPGTCSFVWSRRSALFQGWDGGLSVGQCATFTFAQRDTQFVTEVWTA